MLGRVARANTAHLPLPNGSPLTHLPIPAYERFALPTLAPDMDLAEEPGSPPHGRPLRKGSQVWTDLFLSSVASNSLDYPGP